MELHVLVIDDDEIFNLMADVILRDLGIATHPRCFTNGQDAIAHINRHNGPDDCYLLFLDINMPAMSGWEVLDQLDKLPNHHHIHVVIVTSSIDRADQKTASGFELVIDYMIKPLKREQLDMLKQHKKIAPFFS
ncbi:response regulator [Parapedobacter sp. 10938]|uniref:response regulator n=1 Tax=Parapedobacter flavus TaxID=3110225 RepID=UPI002DBE72D4|nr:response regulator [Parapedobacter sp. 10938]MEC3878544.1 response regulator [Parapedobacter sp. 10938]